ncbi:hypothetical protein [Candidatus Ichthyocystis sparus]|uniref:hypothetical protein n=1 Tax=Candidatus Ichthyocystis sparus TaxID=1561004 RepID=UPI000B834BEC|nr:hypothetical protein [Candidatus Ichthyocystis sparus]
MFVLGAGLCLCGGFELHIGDLDDLLDVNDAAPVRAAPVHDDPVHDDPVHDDPVPVFVDRGDFISFLLLSFMAVVTTSVAVRLIMSDDPPDFYFEVSSIMAGVLSLLISCYALFYNLQ